MRRREFITLLSAGAAVGWPHRGCMQQPTITVIGRFSGGTSDSSADRIMKARAAGRAVLLHQYAIFVALAIWLPLGSALAEGRYDDPSTAGGWAWSQIEQNRRASAPLMRGNRSDQHGRAGRTSATARTGFVARLARAPISGLLLIQNITGPGFGFIAIRRDKSFFCGAIPPNALQ